jgi:hypothetical protein
MAEIKKTDLAEEGVLGNLIPTQEQLKMINQLDVALQSIAKNAKAKIAADKSVDNKKRLQEIKEEEAAQIALERTAREKLKTDRERMRLEEQLRKESERKTKAVKDEDSAYKRVSKTLNDLRNQYKDLAVQGKANTVEAREMLKQINRLDTGLKQVDATVGQHQRSVGNYSNAIKGATGMLQKFGLALGGVAIARDAIGVVRDFEQANATLAAVLGTTADQTQALQNQQKELGASTSFTAAQVAELQTELAKLGFTQTEITQATEGVLMLAKAAGTDLANASAIAGSTLRGFGLEASEMGRVTDVMAKSFSTSALDIEKFKESMKLVAPIANSAGVSLEEATAMLGALANAGISGSNAGTALRRILSEVATTGKPVAEAMAEMAEKGMDLADAEDEVGKNAMSALLILNNSNEQIKELTGTYENAEGSAKAMAETMDNTLNGALARLRSAWEGQILAMNDSTKGASGLTKVINFLANNMDRIVKLVGIALSGFLAWKGTIIATRVATTAYASAVQLMGIATGKAAVQTKAADVAMDGFNKTTKANPLGLLITLLATAVTAFISFADTATAAEKSQQRLNKAIEEGNNAGTRQANMLKAATDELNKEIDRRAQIMRNQGATEKEVNEFVLREREKATQQKLELADAEMQKTEDQRAAYVRAKKQEIAAAEEQIKSLEENANMENAAVRARLQNMRNTVTLAKQDIDIANAKAREKIKALRSEVSATGKALEEILSEQVKHENDMTDTMKTAAKKRAEELALLRRRLEDMQDAEIDEEFTRRQQQLKRALDRELEAIKGNSEVEKELRLALQRKFQKESDALYLEFRKKRLEYADDYLAKEAELEAKRIQEIEKEFADQDKLFEKRHKERRLEALTNTELTAEQVAKIEKESEIQLLEEKIALRKLYGKDTIDLEIELARMRTDLNGKELKTEKDHAESLKAVADAVTDYYEARLDERLAMIDREMNAAQKQSDFYRELAASGNIQASQSLLEQQRIIEEAERERERIEKQKQQLQLISSGIGTYQQKVAAGDKNPLLSTITEITALTRFLSTLPAFYEGTENTGAGGGLDGKGGFLSVLHPNERVMPAKDNKKTGGISNSDLADIGYKYRTGQLIDLAKTDIAGNSFDISALLKKQDELIQAIKEKPVIDYNIEGITSNAFNLMKRVVEGNKTTITKTRFK